MPVPVVAIEPLDTPRSETMPSARRFSPADFSEPETALFEGELARHAAEEGRELAAPLGEPAR